MSDPAAPASRGAQRPQPQPRQQPRVAPGTPAEIGAINALITRALGLAAGSGPPHLFTTLAKHRRLFRPWLRFAGALMPGGTLPRADSELVILGVAHLCGSDYESRHHERLALSAGLTRAQVAAVPAGLVGSDGANGGGVGGVGGVGGGDRPLWTPRQRLLLAAVSELHHRRDLSDELWDQLHAELGEVGVIELCMLVGHYEMLALTLGTLRIQPDALSPGGPPRIIRLLQRRLA